MTVAKVGPDAYTATPTRLMDIKYISPLIVLMLRDGALYYSLYVTAHLLALFSWCLLVTARMFGVFSCQLRSLSRPMFIPPDPAILLVAILFIETAQGLEKSAPLPYVLIFSSMSMV